MHFVATLAAVGSIASLASARVGFQFPESVPLSKRQVTGPAYECHANCGYTIQDAAQEGYCDSTKWKTQFDNCMDCANTYNIWRYYGEKVSAAAQKCGLTANPKPSGAAGGGGSSSASAPATTATPSAPASSAPASSAPASSSAPATQPPASTSQASAPGQTSQSATASQTSAGSSSSVKSTAVATTGRPTGSAAPTSGSNTTSTQIQVGAANLQQPAMLAAGAVALFAVNMI